jgi:hypothetical protein
LGTKGGEFTLLGKEIDDGRWLYVVNVIGGQVIVKAGPYDESVIEVPIFVP